MTLWRPKRFVLASATWAPLGIASPVPVRLVLVVGCGFKPGRCPSTDNSAAKERTHGKEQLLRQRLHEPHDSEENVVRASLSHDEGQRLINRHPNHQPFLGSHPPPLGRTSSSSLRCVSHGQRPWRTGVSVESSLALFHRPHKWRAVRTGSPPTRLREGNTCYFGISPAGKPRYAWIR